MKKCLIVFLLLAANVASAGEFLLWLQEQRENHRGYDEEVVVSVPAPGGLGFILLAGVGYMVSRRVSK